MDGFPIGAFGNDEIKKSASFRYVPERNRTLRGWIPENDPLFNSPPYPAKAGRKKRAGGENYFNAVETEFHKSKRSQTPARLRLAGGSLGTR